MLKEKRLDHSHDTKNVKETRGKYYLIDAHVHTYKMLKENSWWKTVIFASSNQNPLPAP